MTETEWADLALRSEIEYSVASGGKTVEYPDFVHIHNRSVPLAGDFNRAVRVRLSDFASFDRVARDLERIHEQNRLDPPDRLDIYPPPLDESAWNEYLAPSGWKARTVVFFNAPALHQSMPEGLTLYTPPDDEYIAWYRAQHEVQDWFDEDWYRAVKPLQLRFIKVFSPYWLMRSKERVAWVYCANLGEFCRLFEVEVEEPHRGQGVGRLLMDAVRIEAGRLDVPHVLLQAGERLRPFYEKAGFRECTRNSVIRRLQT